MVDENKEIAKALQSLKQPQRNFDNNNMSPEDKKQTHSLKKVPSHTDLSKAKSFAYLKSPTMVLRAQGSMSEKMSFNLNLSPSQESNIALRHQMTDEEKARHAAT